MPNSLTRVLPFALVSSTRLPVSVCGTGDSFHHAPVFSRPSVCSLVARRPGITGFPRLPPQSTQWLNFPQALISTPTIGTGIFTSCPSPTLLSLGLGPTNPTRTDLPSETLDFRRRWFSHLSRYSCQHSHFLSLQPTLPVDLLRSRNAPLPSFRFPGFGGVL